MNPGEIDRFPVSHLEGRYSLVRSAVYKRMEQLGIGPQRVGKRAYITGQQLALMDDLHAFINQQGGSAAEFVEARGLARSPQSAQGGRPSAKGKSGGAELVPFPADVGSLISGIVSEVITRLGGVPQGDPLGYFQTLETAVQKGWLLSTSEVAELLDLSQLEVEGYGDSFFEAGFIFRRSGYRKNGEVAWRVSKRLK
ncbi:MAG: hypothetical protein KGQ93_07615 [Cyanobacteria bacterium REEB459]|nr:hypothetical protein [Cyanobacteria bacterium REEB459]